MTEQEDGSQVESTEGSSNMFASVWVKVEMNNEDNTDLDTLDIKPMDLVKLQNKSNKKTRARPQKILQCELCPYTTVYKNCYNLHIMGHTNSKPYACDACSYTTKYPSSLQRHKLVQHPGKNGDQKKNLHYCDLCEYSTHFKWNLSAHKRKHESDKHFQCGQCNYSTAYRNNYVKHSKVHNKECKEYKCDKCPFRTKFAGHIHRHLNQIHNEVSEEANACDFCDFTTIVRWRLNLHKQRSKQENLLKCSYCTFETYYMCQSKKHKIKHCNEISSTRTAGSYSIVNGVERSIGMNEIRELSANETIENGTDGQIGVANDTRVEYSTNRSSNTKLTVEPNSNDHEKVNNYLVDPNCEPDWSSIQVLESEDKNRPFQCVKCTYTSKFKASVQRHYQRHHMSENRPYKCCNCDFSTKTKDQISLHNKRSKSGTTLTCNICSFQTKFKCTYVMHQKEHYAHKCTICNYSCRHKYDMHKHYSTVHLGDGWKCRFCDYRTARKERLLCHETIHTGDKPFKCQLCDYQSVRKTLLEIHFRRYHGESVVDGKSIECKTNTHGQTR